ncbi:MAG: helix-turn-helix domain-containing protein [Ruminococcus sp.]
MAELSQQKREELFDKLIKNYNNFEENQSPYLFENLFLEEMIKRKIKVKVLAERCGISDRTIGRYRNDAFSVSKRTIIILCIGMGTGKEKCEEMLNAKKFRFTNSSTDSFYKSILELREPLSVDVVNEFIDKFNDMYKSNPAFKKIQRFRNIYAKQ